MSDYEALESLDNKLTAILLLMLERRDIELNEVDKKGLPKTEVLLRDSGFKASGIAKLLNKKTAAVLKTLQRSK